MGVVDYLVVNGVLLSETRGGVESDYIADPLGSTAALMSTAGAITDTFTYWPYGQLRSHVGSSTTPYQYCGTLGYYTDGASGRVYVEARVYMPALTRWLTVDPIWPDQPPYGYVFGSPVTFADPSGMAPCQGELYNPLYPGGGLSYTPPTNWWGPTRHRGPWPKGKPGDPCWKPAPGHFKPTGPGSSCNRYKSACDRGSILACNMYYVCMGAGWQGGISLPPISGPGADCVRGCLLSVFGGQSLASCSCSYAQHQECFSICGWSPPWPFNWDTWSLVCGSQTWGAPEPGPHAWPTP